MGTTFNSPNLLKPAFELVLPARAARRVIGRTFRPIRSKAAIAPLNILAHIAENISSEVVTRELRQLVGSNSFPLKPTSRQRTYSYLQDVADCWISTADFVTQPVALNWVSMLINVLAKLDRQQICFDEGLTPHVVLIDKIAQFELAKPRELSPQPRIDMYSIAEADLVLNVQVSDVVLAKLTLPSAGVRIALDTETFKSMCSLVLLGSPSELEYCARVKEAKARLVLADQRTPLFDSAEQTPRGLAFIGNLWLGRTAIVLRQDRFVAIQRMVNAILKEQRLIQRFEGDEALFLY